MGQGEEETLNVSVFAASETKSELMINVCQPVRQIAFDKDKQLGYLPALQVACPSGIEDSILLFSLEPRMAYTFLLDQESIPRNQDLDGT